MDEFLWDLGSPKAALDLYAAAVCSALRLPYPCYVIISRKLRERVDKLRQASHRPPARPPAGGRVRAGRLTQRATARPHPPV